MFREYRSNDWQDYTMPFSDPHRVIEPLEKEIAIVDDALMVLKEEGIIPHINYDKEKMLAHRKSC